LAALPQAGGRRIGTQAEERLARRLHVSGQGGGVLNGHMDVAEVALQPILAIDGVGPGRVDDQVSEPPPFVVCAFARESSSPQGGLAHGRPHPE
jgi:hypothetical protein